MLFYKKQLFKKEKVKFVRVPIYEEFNAKEIWNQIKDQEKYSNYFKEFSEKGFPNREYMFNVPFEDTKRGLVPLLNNITQIINTVDEGKIEKLI